MLLLTKNDVDQVLDPRLCVKAVKEALALQGRGLTVTPPRQTFHFKEDEGWIAVMASHLGSDMKAFAAKIVTSYPRNIQRGLQVISGLVVYVDSHTGSLLAVMDASRLTALRTGAAATVAIEYLARHDAAKLAMLGSGVQSRALIETITTCKSLEQVKVYSPNIHHRRRFAEDIERSFGVKAQAADSARDAVEKCSLIAAATTSPTPVFDGGWIGDGVHITGVGSHSPTSRELDTNIIRRAKLVVDHRESVLREAGDILIPLSEGAISESHIYAELGEIVAGLKQGRTTSEEITVYKSVGVATLDVALAKLAYETAGKRGVGVEVEL